MNFVDGLIEYTKDYESPGSFWRWAAYATIAGVMRDNVYIQDGDSKLYPNMYILFLAGSGARKNRPVNMAEEFLRKVENTKIIAGRSSIQGILDELSRTESDRKTGKLLKGGSAIFFAPELGAGIVESPEAIKILTDIYDGKTNYVGLLRHSAKTNADKIVFSALMASNEEMSKGLFDNVAIYGGLLARTALIVPNEFRPGNALLNRNEAQEQEREKFKESLIKHLQEVAKLHGRMLFSSEAIKVHTDWYIPFRNRYLAKGDRSGIYGRLHTHVKKLAMVFAADGLREVVSKDDMEQATEECVALLSNYNMFIMAAGKSTLAEISALVLKDILSGIEKDGNDFAITRKEILWRYYSETDGETLDKAMATLEQGGIIQSVLGSLTGVSYRLTPRALEKWGKKK